MYFTMKSIFILSLVLIVGVYTKSSNGTDILSPKIQEVLSRNDGINSVEYVGASADGKVFFKDLYNTDRTWQESRTFCAGFELEQVTFTRRPQVEFLYEASSEGKLRWNYWTSAREQRSQSMLSWDLSSSKLDLSLFDYVGSPPTEASIPFQVCGVISVYVKNMFLDKCSKKFQVLCQIP